jgi:hypothetical protein
LGQIFGRLFILFCISFY